MDENINSSWASFFDEPEVVFPQPVLLGGVRHFYLLVEPLLPDLPLHFLSLPPDLQLDVVNLSQRGVGLRVRLGSLLRKLAFGRMGGSKVVPVFSVELGFDFC